MHILGKEYILPRNLDRKSNTLFLFHRINDEERLESIKYNLSFDRFHAKKEYTMHVLRKEYILPKFRREKEEKKEEAATVGEPASFERK